MPKDRTSKIKSLAKRLRTPLAVQRFLRSLNYNNSETMYSAASALELGKAHCFEATFIAAAILYLNGYEPLVLSLESKDHLDHVVFVYRKDGYWGSIGRSRDQGLHGRRPVYRSIRDLVWSYFDPYIDKTGRITGYCLVNLDQAQCDWRASRKQVWEAEKFLINAKHIPLYSSDSRYRRLHKRYLKYGALKLGKNWL